MKDISKIFKNIVVDALGLIILGLVLVLGSKYSLSVIFAIIGIGLIVIGVLKWVFYFFNKEKEKRSITDLLAGLLMIGAGIVMIVRAEPLTTYFPAVSAILLGYGAVRMIIQAVKSRFETMGICPSGISAGYHGTGGRRRDGNRRNLSADPAGDLAQSFTHQITNGKKECRVLRHFLIYKGTFCSLVRKNYPVVTVLNQ